MKAIRRATPGDPHSALEMIEVPDVTAAKPGDVVVEMQYSPINHYDLHPACTVIEPSNEHRFAGIEGVGRVIEVGNGVDTSLFGRLVVPPDIGTWVERLTVRADELQELPDVDVLQLSMLRITPSAAGLLLSEYVSLKPGDWIIQNAANSSVGRAVISYARAQGIRTINLVRRVEVIDEIAELAGDSVFLDRDSGIAEAVARTERAPIRLALDAVGGGATARLARALTSEGMLVSYAHVARGESPADLRPLLTKGLRLGSFCLADPHYAKKLPALLASSIKLLADKKIHTPIAAVYPASDFARAVAHAIEGGKILLDLRPGRWN